MTAKHDIGSSRPGTAAAAPGQAIADPGDLSARVCQRRRELKLTQQELAARAGMSVPYLAYLENHPASPTGAALRQLAAALQTTPEALLGAGWQPAARLEPGGRAAAAGGDRPN